MEHGVISIAVMYYVPMAILAVGTIAFGMQASLFVRYVFGSMRLRSWNKTAPIEWPGFLAALGELQHRFNWVYRILHSSGQTLGLTSGQFRIEYTIDWLRDKEEALFRNAFSRFATASLLIFGLAGTFWYFIHLVSSSGLISALEQLTKGTGDQTAAYLDLSKAFLGALDGFGQAFRASLAGLAATIILSFSNHLFVERFRSKFVHAWSAIAHDWEQRMLDSRKCSSAETETQKPSVYAPLSAEVTGSEVLKTLNVVNSSLDDAAKTQERWQQLLDTLNDSRDFHLQAITSITQAGIDQRAATQTLADDLVYQIKSEIIPGIANEVKTINAAKIQHFKESEEKLVQHFKALEQTWEGKLEQTLASFTEESKQVTSVAQQELAATRSEALTAGERVAEAIRSETQQALNAFQNLLNMANESQKESASIMAHVQELHGEVRRLMKEDKEALASYMQELRQSLDAWKKAPKAIEATLAKVSEVTAELTCAMQEAGKIPSRWQEEIDQISNLLKNGYNHRRQATFWYQLSSKTGNAWERAVSYARNLKK